MQVRNIIKNFILTIVSVIIISFLLEGFIRFVLKDKPRGKDKVELKEQPISFIQDEILGWKPKTGNFKFEPWSKNGNITKLTNLEDGRRFTGKNQEEKKVIFIGGSLTQGWAVDDSESFVWLLQEKKQDFNFINYGVGGYGGVQSLLKLKEISSNMDNINYIIYGFIPHHEVRNIASGSWMYQLNKASRGTEGKLLLPYASIKNDELRIHKPKEYLKLPLGNISAFISKIEKRILKISSLKRSFDETKISQEIILEMKGIADKKNAKFILLFLNKLPDEKRAEYVKFFNEKSIQNINCYFLEGEKYAVEGEGHPNAVSHKIVSDCIYSKLFKN